MTTEWLNIPRKLSQGTFQENILVTPQILRSNRPSLHPYEVNKQNLYT